MATIKRLVAAAILVFSATAAEADPWADVPAGMIPFPVAPEPSYASNNNPADAVRELLEHDASTAGRMMSPIVFAGRRAQSVAQAIGALQEESERVQGSLIYLYVVDDDERLCGVVNMRRLLVSKPDTPLERIMDRDVIAVTTETSQEETARLIEQYHLMALPVIDAEEVLVGQVTVDDVIDVLQDEATEELLALSGVSVDERPDTPATRSLRLRAPWLVINLGTAFLAASVVGMFTGTIGKLPALAAVIFHTLLASGPTKRLVPAPPSMLATLPPTETVNVSVLLPPIRF
mgnify:CR=1 FL=1